MITPGQRYAAGSFYLKLREEIVPSAALVIPTRRTLTDSALWPISKSPVFLPARQELKLATGNRLCLGNVNSKHYQGLNGCI